MKLSEAIRLGGMTDEQAFGSAMRGDATCAAMGAFKAMGLETGLGMASNPIYYDGREGSINLTWNYNVMARMHELMEEIEELENKIAPSGAATLGD